MKTLLVGSLFTHPDVTPISFLSQKYLSDYDLLIIEIDSLMVELTKDLGVNNGYALISKKDIVQKRLNERVDEIKEFYKHGGIVCVIVNSYPIYKCNLLNHQNVISGTFSADLLNIFSLHDLSYTALSGDIVECDQMLANLAERCYFNYHAFIDNCPGRKLLWTRKAKNVVSFSSEYEKGIFYCVPGLKLRNSISPNNSQLVLEELFEVSEKLKDAAFSQEIIAPSWIQDFIIGNEGSDLIEFNKLDQQINSLQNLANGLSEKLNKYAELKSLVYLDGTSLENKVKSIFQSIGFSVEQPEGHDVDLIIQMDDFIGVIETKGVKGSGAKANSRQLENWVTNYSIANNKDAKGILIINAFKNTPLAQRTEIAFPPDMVAYSKQREHCLLLTKDLMYIYIDYENGLIDKQNIAKLFLGCNGILNYKPRFKSAVLKSS